MLAYSEHDRQLARYDQLLDAARRDCATVNPQGMPLGRLPDGVSVRELPRHIDKRGSVTELFDPQSGWHADPVLFAYMFTIRPNVVKGWNLHLEREVRYVVVGGEMELVFYDARPGSDTFGEVSKIALSGGKPTIVNVPAKIWYADHNIGSEDVVAVNFPTVPYDHSDPDRYHLPIDTALIPYTFGDAMGA